MNAPAKTTFTPPIHAAVWFEVPVSDMTKAQAFYRNALLTEFRQENSGPNPMAIFAYSGGPGGVSGHLYPGKPAAAGAGATIHFPVPDSVEAGLERVKAAGGKVVSPVIEIPDGRFAYCLDPDGNSIGIYTR